MNIVRRCPETGLKNAKRPFSV